MAKVAYIGPSLEHEELQRGHERITGIHSAGRHADVDVAGRHDVLAVCRGVGICCSMVAHRSALR